MKFNMLPILFIGLFTASASSTDSPRAEDEQYLRHLKQHHWPEIYKTGDVNALDELTHPDFVIIDPQGRTTNKKEELAFLETYIWPHQEFAYTIERITFFENDTAIVSGQGKASGENKNGSYCFTYVSSNVLIKRNNQWKAIQSHVSGYSPECEQ